MRCLCDKHGRHQRNCPKTSSCSLRLKKALKLLARRINFYSLRCSFQPPGHYRYEDRPPLRPGIFVEAAVSAIQIKIVRREIINRHLMREL